jgi:hypothetical protein
MSACASPHRRCGACDLLAGFVSDDPAGCIITYDVSNFPTVSNRWRAAPFSR